MFVSVKLIKGNEYVYIVENTRVEGRVVQRIVQYIGRADAATIASLRAQYARRRSPPPSRAARKS